MSLFDIKVDFKLDADTDNLPDKFAKNVVEQFRKKLGVTVDYKINNDEIVILIEQSGEKKKNIPYKVINGQIVVPKEYQKYLSADKRSLNINESSDYNKAIQNIDLNIFK